MGSQFKPIKGRKAFIQILNVNNNHWVTVSNKVGDLVFTDNVYVYDSLQHTRIAMTIKKQVCTFFKSTESYIFFIIVDMKRQSNTYDCGVFAIAAATDIACGKDPAKSQWIASDMRPHLKQCFLQGEMLPFPTLEDRRIRFGRRIKVEEKVDIHCNCQMPYDPNERNGDMIQCSMCLVWFHERCTSDHITDFKHCKWYCSSCSCILN